MSSLLKTGHRWELHKNNKSHLAAIIPWLQANDASVLFEAAISGAGIALLADFITSEALQSGMLQPVLADWMIPTTGIYALYPDTRYLAAKTRVFVDYLVEVLSPIRE